MGIAFKNLSFQLLKSARDEPITANWKGLKASSLNCHLILFCMNWMYCTRLCVHTIKPSPSSPIIKYTTIVPIRRGLLQINCLCVCVYVHVIVLAVGSFLFLWVFYTNEALKTIQSWALNGTLDCTLSSQSLTNCLAQITCTQNGHRWRGGFSLHVYYIPTCIYMHAVRGGVESD